MQFLIIGGTGFLGYHIVRACHQRGHQVTVLALPPLPAPDLLPAGVKTILADLDSLSDGELQELLAGVDGVVFAAGADDRTVPSQPAYSFFHRANVEPTARLIRLAREAGVQHGVVLSSYFLYFNRIWPALRLADQHPYIRSRREQAARAFEAAGPDFKLAVLELPFIFGAMPGRPPLWVPLIRYLRSPWPLFCIPGGTNTVSVAVVARAALNALEKGAHGEYLVGDENLTWAELFSRLLEADHSKRKLIQVPLSFLKPVLALLKVFHRLQGKEGGLDPLHLPDLLGRELFFDPALSWDVLEYGSGGLDQALRETLTASDPGGVN